MPFTFSHPAAILPFRNSAKHKISLTALALGSMAPDFEFFFRMKAQTDISHTIPGIFLFNIPVVLVLAFLYHGWVRNPLLHHLPAFLQARFLGYGQFHWGEYVQRHWGVVLISAFLGVLTHFICDAFTHKHGWFVQQIPLLASSMPMLGKTLPVYHFLQYFSSLVMAVVLGWAAFRLPPVAVERNVPGFFRYWLLVTGVTVLTCLVRFWPTGEGAIRNDVIMTVISGGLLGLLVASGASRWLKF